MDCGCSLEITQFAIVFMYNSHGSRSQPLLSIIREVSPGHTKIDIRILERLRLFAELLLLFCHSTELTLFQLSAG